jgi:hypothetical protein
VTKVSLVSRRFRMGRDLSVDESMDLRISDFVE